MTENIRKVNDVDRIPEDNEPLLFDDFKKILNSYGLMGETPKDRLQSLCSLPKESIPLFMTDLNSRIQGLDESRIHDKTMKIGDKLTVTPENRYQVFSNIIEKIKEVKGDINPARVGDTLALATVILHPFEDANGRTARAIGFIYRPEFDNEDGSGDFERLIQSRDITREKGGFIINGYIPYTKDVDLTQTSGVDHYVEQLLTQDTENSYTGPYGQAPLRVQVV